MAAWISPREHRRNAFSFALRYRAGTYLSRRSPAVARGRFRTAQEAENVRASCPNSEHIEVVDLREIA